MNLLEQIVATKRREIAERSAEKPLEDLLKVAPEVPLPRLSDALAGDSLHVIAELKYQSPSLY